MRNNETKKYIRIQRNVFATLLSTVFALSAFLGISSNVFAADATLFFSPITGTYTTGEPVTIRVMVATGGEGTNAIEGVLHYDPKNVEVIAIDHTNSILSSWTQEPVFDNTKGEVFFAGGMSGTSSYLGVRGEVIAITIRGLRSEETRFSFDSGSASSVHAADGTGGNLLSALTSGVYVFFPKEDTLALPTPVSTQSRGEILTENSSLGEVLGASTGTPILSSKTHPDQNAWYNMGTSTINWDMPSGVSNVRLGLDKKPKGEGFKNYSAPINSKEITAIADGIWYVHLTREWLDGHTDNDHFRLQIDSLPPSLVSVSERPRADTTDPNVAFTIVATDTFSGIDRYEIVIDGGAAIPWVDDGSHEYVVQPLAPGEHTLVVTAYDKAGNHSDMSVVFTIDYLTTPVVTRTSQDAIFENHPLVVALSGVPGAKIFVAITREGSSPITEEYLLDGSGKGVLTSVFIPTPGVYHVSAVAKKANGAISRQSEQIEITVTTSFFGIIKRNPLIPVAIIALLLLIFFAWMFGRRYVSNDKSEEDEIEAEAMIEEEMPEHHMGETSHARAGTVVLGAPRKKTRSMHITKL